MRSFLSSNLTLLPAIALVACEPGGSQSSATLGQEEDGAEELRSYEAETIPVPGVAGEAPEVPMVAVDVPESLEGHYRVAGVGGESIDMAWAMTLVVDEEQIRLTSQCVQPVWSYRYAEGELATTSLPVAICERERYPEEEAAIAAIDGATSVTRTPQNGLLLAGEGGTLTIFSQ